MEWIAVGIGLTMFGMGVFWGYKRGVHYSASFMTDYILAELEKQGTIRLTRRNGEVVKIEPGTKAYGSNEIT